MLLEELGNRIRSQREKRGLKQQDIANALNISPQAVSKWERGENAPDIGMLPSLARLLGVSTDWLLSVNEEGRDVFEATVLATSVYGAYKKSVGMEPRDFANWANGIFLVVTEISLHYNGVPVKYMGDGYLCFFSGVHHRERAIDAAVRIRRAVSEDIKIGLATGEIYLGSVGHHDYARADIMGEVVNIAFLTMEWAECNAESGIAAAETVLEGLSRSITLGKRAPVHFRGVAQPEEVAEIVPP